MNERRAQVCRWAYDYLHDTGNFVVLDSETTGLSGSDEVIELTILSASGVVLFTSLIKPQDPHREDLATHIHGISAEMLASAPTFSEVWPAIEAILQQAQQVLVYNAAFDHRLLYGTARRYGFTLPSVTWTCLMEQYAIYHGAWNRYHQSYVWQKLQEACRRMGVQVNGDFHRATADTLCTLGLLQALAALHTPLHTPEKDVQV